LESPLKKVFFKDSIFYGATSYLSVLAGIILTPIYTRYFTKEEYGMMDLVNTWNTLMLLLIPLGLTTAMVRLYYDYHEDEGKKRTNLGTLLMALVGSSVLFVVLSWALEGILVLAYYGVATNPLLIRLSYGIVVFNVLMDYFQSLNRVQFRLKSYLVVQVVPFFVLVLLGYYLSIVTELRIAGFFYAGFISSLAGLLLAAVLGRDQLYFSFDFKALTEALKYALPLLVVLVFLRFTSIVDRTIITSMIDLRAVGDYSIVTRISSLFQLAISSFATAWIPYAMSVVHKPDRDAIYARAFQYFLLGFGVIGGVIVLFNREILLLFAPDYLNVEFLVYIMIPTTLLGGLAHFMGLGITASKKSGYFIVSALVSFAVNVGVSYTLALYIGLYGIAVGSFVAIAAWVLLEYHFSTRLSSIRYPLKYMIYAVCFIAACGGIAFFINGLTMECSWILLLKTGLGLSMALVMYRQVSTILQLKGLFSSKGR
jgi:O-antigen/teichoic acid export membrane protein